MAEKSVKQLKATIAALWHAENELRYSAWHALTLDVQMAEQHLALARDHLNRLLNKEDPVDHLVTPVPPMDPEPKE